jgi:hypothetical protein
VQVLTNPIKTAFLLERLPSYVKEIALISNIMQVFLVGETQLTDGSDVSEVLQNP